MAKRFSQQISDFVAKSEARTRAVMQESAKELVTRAQRPVAQGGSMPVVTGNLRNSLVVAINGVKIGEGGDSHMTAIAAYRVGDEIFVGWTANYARRMEYGFTGTDSLGRNYNQQGYHFLGLAVQKWQSIVLANVKSIERISR